jgi:hypothetical protein
LVELLVVIAIIMLLIALVMPVVRTVRFSAQRVACGSNMRQLFLGFKTYSSDHNGFLPCSYPIAPGMKDWVGGGMGRPVSGGTIWDYMLEERVYMCPSDSRYRYWLSSWRKATHSYSMPKARDCNHLGMVGADKSLLVDESETTINDGRFVHNWDTFASRHMVSGWGKTTRANAGGNVLCCDGGVHFFRASEIVGADHPLFESP